MADQNLKVTLSAVDKTRQAFASVRGGLSRIGRSVANVKTALIGLGATVALKQFATQIDNLAKASSRLGLTVNQIQTLQFAASQTGASSEELEKGLTRFSRSISEASTGLGVGVKAFEALGISVTNTDGALKPTNELLNEVSDRLSGIKDPADKVRIAFDLFGRSGVNLVNTLQAGSSELKKLRDEFNSVTFQLTQEDAKAVEQANDLFDKLGRTFSSIGQSITSFVLPPLSRLARFLTTSILTGFAVAIDGARDFVNFFIDSFNKIGEVIKVFPKIDEVTFGKDITRRLREIVSSYDNVGESIKKVNEPLRINVQGFARVKEELKPLKTVLNDTEKAFIGVAKSATDRMTDSLMGLIQGTVKAKDAFRDMANSIISDLIRMAIRKYITDQLFGIATKAISGAFGAPVVGSGVEGGSVVGARAIGGSVQRGRPYMVGERGAELFVPNRNGAIVPNDAMGSGGVVVNQTINLSTGVAQTVRTEVLGMLPQIAEAAKGAVYDARRRGGQFGSAFGA